MGGSDDEYWLAVNREKNRAAADIPDHEEDVKSILDRQIGDNQPRHETTAIPPGTTTPAGMSNTPVTQRSVANGFGGKRPWLPT
jgi:hypothetical protein